VTATPFPDEAWPYLSYYFGLHPRDVTTPPEEGGLTYAQIEAYLDQLEEMPPIGGVWLYSKRG